MHTNRNGPPFRAKFRSPTVRTRFDRTSERETVLRNHRQISSCSCNMYLYLHGASSGSRRQPSSPTRHVRTSILMLIPSTGNCPLRPVHIAQSAVVFSLQRMQGPGLSFHTEGHPNIFQATIRIRDGNSHRHPATDARNGETDTATTHKPAPARFGGACRKSHQKTNDGIPDVRRSHRKESGPDTVNADRADSPFRPPESSPLRPHSGRSPYWHQ